MFIDSSVVLFIPIYCITTLVTAIAIKVFIYHKFFSISYSMWIKTWILSIISCSVIIISLLAVLDKQAFWMFDLLVNLLNGLNFTNPALYSIVISASITWNIPIFFSVIFNIFIEYYCLISKIKNTPKIIFKAVLYANILSYLILLLVTLCFSYNHYSKYAPEQFKYLYY